MFARVHVKKKLPSGSGKHPAKPKLRLRASNTGGREKKNSVNRKLWITVEEFADNGIHGVNPSPRPGSRACETEHNRICIIFG